MSLKQNLIYIAFNNDICFWLSGGKATGIIRNILYY